MHIILSPDMVNHFQDTLLLYPTPMGALTQLYAGTMPEALNYNGEARRFVTGDSILPITNENISPIVLDTLGATRAFEGRGV